MVCQAFLLVWATGFLPDGGHSRTDTQVSCKMKLAAGQTQPCLEGLFSQLVSIPTPTSQARVWKTDCSGKKIRKLGKRRARVTTRRQDPMSAPTEVMEQFPTCSSEDSARPRDPGARSQTLAQMPSSNFHDLKSILMHQVVVVHTCNPSTQEADAGGSLSLRPAWSTQRVPDSQGYIDYPCLEKQNKDPLQNQNPQENIECPPECVIWGVPKCDSSPQAGLARDNGQGIGSQPVRLNPFEG